RQDFVRSFVAGRVRNEVDLAKDTRADTRAFVIARGETAGQIAKRLEDEGIIRSALAFDFVLYETERENALQSGTYTVSAAFTPRELARLFEKAPGDQIVLRIIEGWRLTEVATAVNKAFPTITKEVFTAAAVVGDRKNTVLTGMDEKASLEGYLFPDTYFMRPDATAAQIVEVLLDTFERKVGAKLRTASAARNVAIYDIVKLASIVEREARDRSESATIAGVYTNRLKIGMKLDADPTIQYALGEWRELSLDDLKLDSPYNTYLYAGLPPTPIANSGVAALEGAAKPADVPWFYFVAKSDGTGGHAFAITIEEHEANRVKYGNK
ncbi:MAG: endolytic transglycosylase MltG, partial [Candidatus Limnocylindria bacterium]